MYDLIIIGSGPAGLGAAIYGKRAGYSTLVLEKNPMSGGQVLNTCEVDNYLGLPGINGFDLGMQFREHADRLGTEFVEADVTGIKNLPDCKKVLTSAGEFTAKAVIIAAGAEHKKLGVPGEKRLAGRGISYCATCDGAFYKKKVTAVIGGGDVAVEDAIFLAGLCEKVYLIHRRDSLRAAKSLQEKLFTLPNVELVWNAAVEEITGEAQDYADAMDSYDKILEITGEAFVTGVQLLDTQTKEERFVAADGIFIAVGIQPVSESFKSLVKTDEAGYICAGEDCCTSVPGIFAVGDVRTKKLRQIVTAVADGANAVNSVQEYFQTR